MKRSLRKIGLAMIVFLIAFIWTVPAYASCGCKITYEDGTQKNVLGVPTSVLGNVDGCSCDDGNGNTFTEIMVLIIDILEGAAVVLAVVGISVFGITYLTAGGNENQVMKAKRRLLQIVIGLVAFSLTWSVSNWLLPGGAFNSSRPKIKEMVALSAGEVAVLEANSENDNIETPGSSGGTPSGSGGTPSGSGETPSGGSETPGGGETPTPTPTTLTNSDPNTTFTSYYTTGNNVNFLTFVPSTADGNKLPLIIYLHGDSGHGTTDHAIRSIVGISDISDWPSSGLNGINAYILCPQTRTKDNNWGNPNNISARDEVWDKVQGMVAEGKVDPNKIAIIGQSRGSYGVQYFLTDPSRIGKFSAAVLLSGYGAGLNLSNAPAMQFIYGSNDAGPKSNASFFRNYGAIIKEYSGKGHDDVVEAALTDDANGDKKSDLFEWILSQ